MRLKPLPRDDEFTPSQVVEILSSTGRWSCWCPPHRLNAVRVKLSTAARRAGLAYRGVYEPELARFTGLVEIRGGECGPGIPPNTWEEANLAAVRELRATIRMLMAEMPKPASSATMRAKQRSGRESCR